MLDLIVTATDRAVVEQCNLGEDLGGRCARHVYDPHAAIGAFDLYELPDVRLNGECARRVGLRRPGDAHRGDLARAHVVADDALLSVARAAGYADRAAVIYVVVCERAAV